MNSLKGYENSGDVEVRHQFLDDECLSVFLGDEKAIYLLKKHSLRKYKQCVRDSNEFRESALFKGSHIVVYSSEWKRENIEYIPAFFHFLKDSGKKGVLLGPNALFLIRPGDMLVMSSSREEINSLAFKYLDKDVLEIDRLMRDIAKENYILFLSKIRHVCNQNQCEMVYKDDMLSFLDHTHWTYIAGVRFGKKIFGSKLKNINNLR